MSCAAAARSRATVFSVSFVAAGDSTVDSSKASIGAGSDFSWTLPLLEAEPDVGVDAASAR
jgi:hypothetical protein